MKPNDRHLDAPIVYNPSYEILEPDEKETEAGLVDALTRIAETVFQHSEHARRAVHAKSHGLLRGVIEVLPDLPATHAQGICARPGTRPALLRLSTTPGDMLSDKVSTPRGMALKMVGVEGERLAGSEGDVTQDFVLVDSPAFSAPSARKFLANLKLLAATTDKAPELKKALSALLRGAEHMLESAGKESATLVALGGHPETHPLGETYFSQAPILWGPYMAKVAVAPVSPALQALAGSPVDLKDNPDGLRDAVRDFFAAGGAEWELCVQLCTDLERMPIEDATVPWPEELSPYLPVARIRVPAQVAWSGPRSYAVDDGMSFSPWHGLAAHRPIGSIMRVRKAAYEMSARFRAGRNGHRVKEPASFDDLPD
ncbi:catalase family protein [Herbaspirillum sp. WKF16]|uniref:catalase family protein n=1 Tax=Herbaspirillum sp. WKF16 TaxID=3028312 RepID=UPI0023A9AB83|nr:catalase family protein [Herbaspirillum sp. WKF16]WDZ97385.1 catalase family protein [Herbaspirillum sp. WKF16]